MPVLIVATIFGVVGWIVYVIATNIRQAQAARGVAALHSKLLDKCAASEDLLAYLESAAGRKFLESAAAGSSNPWTRILNAVQAGIVLSLVGAAELIVRTQQQNWDANEFLLMSGAVALATGVGFILSAGMSFALCKSWGLLTPSQNIR